MWRETRAVADREVGSGQLEGQNDCEHGYADGGGGYDGDGLLQ